MQREKDYLKKKIDKLAVMLAELLAKMSKTNNTFTKEEFETKLDEILRQETKLYFSMILEMKEDDFIEELKQKHNLNSNQLYVLADLLYHYSLNFEENTTHLNPKIVALYENSIAEGIVISLNKYTLIDKLKNN